MMKQATLELDAARRLAQTRPPGRSSHAMVYDSNRRAIMLFGSSEPGHDTTWEYRPE